MMSTENNTKAEYIDTDIGRFNISMPPEDFICREPPSYINDGEITIKSCLTKVIFTISDGGVVVLEPVTIESCMKPGEKIIIPITYRCCYDMEGKVIQCEVFTPYRHISIVYAVAEWQKAHKDTSSDIYYCEDIAAVCTQDYEPHLKVESCAVCRNCGRC